MSKVNLSRVKAGDLELKEKVVSINRVVKTTKGGRAFSFSALVVVGNEHGVVGHGLGKAKEVQEAITKGIEDAKKNLIKVPIMHGTIPHDQLAKEGIAYHPCALHMTLTLVIDEKKMIAGVRGGDVGIFTQLHIALGSQQHQ